MSGTGIAGRAVTLPTTLGWNARLKEDREGYWLRKVVSAEPQGSQANITLTIPSGFRGGHVEPETFNRYRSKLVYAATDVVVYTRMPPDNVAAIISIQRITEPHHAKYWLPGGAWQAYRTPEESAVDHAIRELKVAPEIEARVGIFLVASDTVPSVAIRFCFVGFIDFAKLTVARTDSSHGGWLALTQDRYQLVAQAHRHWYPDTVFQRVFETMPALSDR